MYTQKVGSGECGKGTPRMPRLLVRFKSFVCVFLVRDQSCCSPSGPIFAKFHGMVS